MKITFCLMAMLCAFLLNANFASAQHQTIQVDTTNQKKPKKKPKAFKLESEFEASSGYEYKNKTPAVEGANVRNRTTARMNFKKFDVSIAGEFITAIKADPDNVLGGIELGVSKHFTNVNVSVKNTFYFKYQQRFGLIEGELSKTKHLAEDVGLTFFTNVAGYYALEGANNHVSNGVTWNNGAVFEAKLGKGHFETKLQTIADQNALLKGKRLAGNMEMMYLYHVPKTRMHIGPKAELTGFWKGVHESHLHKRNVFNFGMLIKFM